jgi:hypothetical protein
MLYSNGSSGISASVFTAPSGYLTPRNSKTNSTTSKRHTTECRVWRGDPTSERAGARAGQRSPCIFEPHRRVRHNCPPSLPHRATIRVVSEPHPPRPTASRDWRVWLYVSHSLKRQEVFPKDRSSPGSTRTNATRYRPFPKLSDDTRSGARTAANRLL